MEIAGMYKRLQWVDVWARSESEHRGMIWDYCKDFDVLVNADSDEVWNPLDLARACKEVYNSPYRNHGINGFVHFWRSFGNVVAGCESGGNECEEADFFRPVRLFHLREKNTERQPDINARIYHFGYAVKRRIMTYKVSVHGHRHEWRPEWMDLWQNWSRDNTKGNFHPTSFQIWHKIVPFDRNLLPEFMRYHPFYNSELI